MKGKEVVSVSQDWRLGLNKELSCLFSHWILPTTQETYTCVPHLPKVSHLRRERGRLSPGLSTSYSNASLIKPGVKELKNFQTQMILSSLLLVEGQDLAGKRSIWEVGTIKMILTIGLWRITMSEQWVPGSGGESPSHQHQGQQLHGQQGRLMKTSNQNLKGREKNDPIQRKPRYHEGIWGT